MQLYKYLLAVFTHCTAYYINISTAVKCKIGK